MIEVGWGASVGEVFAQCKAALASAGISGEVQEFHIAAPFTEGDHWPQAERVGIYVVPGLGAAWLFQVLAVKLRRAGDGSVGANRLMLTGKTRGGMRVALQAAEVLTRAFYGGSSARGASPAAAWTDHRLARWKATGRPSTPNAVPDGEAWRGLSPPV